jgi:hypothetical protein
VLQAAVLDDRAEEVAAASDEELGGAAPTEGVAARDRGRA